VHSLSTAVGGGPVGSAVAEFALATVAVAFLTVFLSSSRGPKGFAWLANGAANLVHLIVAPVDPLGGIGSANQGAPTSAPVFAGAPTGAPPAVVQGGAKGKKAPPVAHPGSGSKR
jgi:hypothetical protein